MEIDTSIELSPDGRFLARVLGDRVRVIDVDRGREVGTVPGTAAALVQDAIWVAHGHAIVRYDAALAAGCSTEVGSSCGVLQRVVYGEPAVLWTGSEEPARLLVAHGRADTEPAVMSAGFQPAPGDRLVPLTPHRIAYARRSTMVMVEASGRQRWSFDGGATMLHAAPVFEGRWIASLAGRLGGAEQQLVLLDARDGCVQRRLVLRDITAARFTAMRGLAILRAAEHHLVVIDLRFGKVLRDHDASRPIRDFAIDDAGQRVVVEYGDGELVVMAVADLLAGRITVAGEPAETASEPVATEVPAPVAEPARAPEPPAAPVTPIVVPPLLALQPRAAAAACSGEDASRWLDAHCELVAALAARAIALGWDTGSIAFVDKDRPPFELEVAALVLGVRGLAEVQLRRTTMAVEVASARVASVEAALGASQSLQALAAELALDELDRRLLMLIAAPALWGELARLYGILANDERRALCDEQLLVQLCGRDERLAIARALDRERPLVRHGLVQVGGDRARPFAALAVDPIVLRILRGEPLEIELDRGVELAPVAPPLDALIVPRAALQRAIDALARPHETAVRLVIRGRAGSGRRTLASALAAHAGRRVGVVDVAIHARERSLDRVAALLRRTALRGWLPLLDGVESVGDDQRDTLLEVVRDHPGPLALRLAREASLRLPGAIEIDIPPLTIGQCAEHWCARLDEAGLEIADVDALAARFRVGPGVIDRCVASLGDAPRTHDPVQDVEHAVRRHLASRLGDVATRVDRLPTWSQVVLPDDIEDSVLELIARIRHQRTVYDTWGFEQVMSTARGITALFQGPPGTGKTLVAGAIANELGLDLYRIDVSRVMSKWIGETEQNLAKVFAAAEESQAILLFDEADSLFAKRTAVRSSNDRYANTEVNYLLQRLDSFEGIAILTTNFGTSIDAAFKRRLSFRLTFPFPDDETRELLWKAHLPPRLPRAGTIDLGALARRFRMSGGYIRNAALRAAFLAAEERSPLTQDHLERAIRAEFREIGNLADTGELS